jgi:hypothetical protein
MPFFVTPGRVHKSHFRSLCNITLYSVQFYGGTEFGTAVTRSSLLTTRDGGRSWRRSQPRTLFNHISDSKYVLSPLFYTYSTVVPTFQRGTAAAASSNQAINIHTIVRFAANDRRAHLRIHAHTYSHAVLTYHPHIRLTSRRISAHMLTCRPYLSPTFSVRHARTYSRAVLISHPITCTHILTCPPHLSFYFRSR